MTPNLVSVIMPNYNTEGFIEESINSVLKQTYHNLELIIVDDLSTDNSVKKISELQKIDDRIKLIELKSNSGAAFARNIAVKFANGEFIAFIDSDDIWNEEKLRLQLDFMKNENLLFVGSYYKYIDFQGNDLNKIIKGKKVRNYWQILKDSPGNSTVIYNARLLGKTYVPIIKKRNDYLMWLNVVKKAKNITILPEVLVNYRIRANSLSHSKMGLVKYHWKIYREHEHLNIVKSVYLVTYFISKGVLRKLKIL